MILVEEANVLMQTKAAHMKAKLCVVVILESDIYPRVHV